MMVKVPFGYNTLTLGGMVRVPGMSGTVRVPGFSESYPLPKEYEVDVGTAGQVNWDVSKATQSVPTITRIDEPPTTTVVVPESETNRSPITNALKSLTSWGQRPPVVAASPGVPQWVWVAAPLVAGAMFLTFVATRGPRRLAGYRRR